MKKRNRLLILIASLLVAALFIFESFLIFRASSPSSSNSSSGQTNSSAASSSSRLNAKYSQSQLNKLSLPQLSDSVASGETRVTFDTSAGTIVAKIFNQYAPLAAENFLTKAKAGNYNGLDFFRVVKDFMIQSGDPQNVGTGGSSIWASGSHKNAKIDSGTGFKNEITPHLYFVRGAIGMANTGQSNSNGSQFFIEASHSDARQQIQSKSAYPSKIYDLYKNGGTPSLDGKYTVFGQVISGMDVVDKIANAAVKANPTTSENSYPTNMIKINRITVDSH